MNRELIEGKVYLEAQPEIKFEVEKKKGCCDEFKENAMAIFSIFIPFHSFIQYIKVIYIL